MLTLVLPCLPLSYSRAIIHFHVAINLAFPVKQLWFSPYLIPQIYTRLWGIFGHKKNSALQNFGVSEERIFQYLKTRKANNSDLHIWHLKTTKKGDFCFSIFGVLQCVLTNTF